jgi:hypothetical protein
MKPCPNNHPCANNARMCPICGHRFPGPVLDLIIVPLVVAGILAVVGVMLVILFRGIG